MAGPKEQPKHSGISAQLFELLKVVFTLVLTGIVGGGITYYYQNRSHREQQETQELETARQSALTFLREVGDILEQRRHHAFQVLYSVRDNAPPEEKEQVWKDYLNAVNAWNMKWNIYRALVLEQFGPEMQKRFYDETADTEGVWEKSSITGKLIIFHNVLTEFHKQNPDKPLPAQSRSSCCIRRSHRTAMLFTPKSLRGFKRAEWGSAPGRQRTKQTSDAHVVTGGNGDLDALPWK